MKNGQTIVKRTKTQLIVDTNDEIKLRGKRPITNKHDKATVLNFAGRVKMTSRKNA